MIRHFSCKENVKIVAKLVILLLGMSTQITARPSKQSQNENLYFNDENNAEIFHDTKVLPEGSEVKAYLLFNETIKVLFLVEDDNSPVSLKVTPCASAVESSVLYKSISRSSDYEDNDPFEDQLKATERDKIVYSYKGSSAHTFQRSSNSSGVYTVRIRPTQSDTYVKFFLQSKTFASSKFYPTLPKNSSILAERVRRKSFLVSWNPSQDETPFDNIITYCVSISLNRSYDNHCSLMSHMFGDKVPKPPKNSGFFFPWEDEVQRIFRNKANPVKKVNPKEIHYSCVGSDKKYIFTQARPGKLYFVNVYAVNKRTSRSSSYKKLEIRTKKRKKRERIGKLKEGKFYEFEFKKSKLKYEFKYELKNTSDVFLAVHSCIGKIKVKVTRGTPRGKTVLKKKVKSSSVLQLKNLEADTYYVELRSRRKHVPKSVRLIVSTRQSKLWYPSLPKNLDVFLVENSTTSNSLTIGWRVTNSRQKFCIYQKEILLAARRKRRRHHDQCSKNSQLPIDSKKVKCVKVGSKSKMVLNHQIRNLKSNARYQFDVVIQIRKGYSILYKSLQTSTKSR